MRVVSPSAEWYEQMVQREADWLEEFRAEQAEQAKRRAALQRQSDESLADQEPS